MTSKLCSRPLKIQSASTLCGGTGMPLEHLCPADNDPLAEDRGRVEKSASWMRKAEESRYDKDPDRNDA